MNSPQDPESPAYVVDPESLPVQDELGSPSSLTLRFVGSGSEYFRIWIVSILLILVTLGLYYPFAKARRLKYFHGATELAGQPFGFHADPWKMFRGYLLVAVMVGLYSLAGQVSPTGGLVALAIVAAIWPALWHSSLRFRFANTSWRGLRFHFRGTRGGAYKVFAWPFVVALLFFGLVFLAGLGASAGHEGSGDTGDEAGSALVIVVMVVLVLGLYFVAGPVFLWLMQRYRQKHLALGSEHSDWRVTAGSYITLVLKTLGVSLLPLFVLGAVGALVVPAMADRGDGDGPGFLVIVFLVLAYVLAIAVSFGYFTARQQNLVWNATASAHLAFHSQLSASKTILLWAKNWLLTIVTLSLYYPFAQVAMAKLRLEAVEVRLSMPLEELTAKLDDGKESAAGDAAGDLLGWDIGL